MPRDTQRERLVDAAIDVGQLDLEGVHRRGQRHGEARRRSADRMTIRGQ
jgi:hypothetical protein